MSDDSRDDMTLYVVIARAGDDDSGGRHVELRFLTVGEPRPVTRNQVREGAVKSFRAAFGEEPERVGVAALPSFDDLDEGRTGDEDE